MPESPTALSPDVQRLVDEGYTVSIEGDYIIVDKVPYVSAPGTVSDGAIISAYKTHNGIAQVGNNHTVWFTGSVPCTPTGQSLANALVADTNRATVAGRQVLCRLSYKAERPGMLDNYYNKLTHYIRKLQGYANVIDASASAIGNQKLRLAGNGHRDHDALTHSGAQLERIAVQYSTSVRNAHVSEQSMRLVRQLRFGDVVV